MVEEERCRETNNREMREEERCRENNRKMQMEDNIGHNNIVYELHNGGATCTNCGVLLFYWIITDTSILDKSLELGKGGSTAVTSILIDCQKLVVANVGDSRAVACKNGVAKQLSVDHEPSKERTYVKDRGGFVSNFPGDVLRVGQLAVARAFGDKSLKKHLSSEPDVSLEIVDEDTEFVILASDGK
ncbi:probable protein phosphatase 2C 39 [Camellia sinensis]|uniref:probable protein phosphatase 2C 39 n=1 Tax=Camellia sinensis TaxID=4442 RepID=UPI0010365A92|nr:probable protein phosphatase 2C 39 [Camellia sinensis]